MAELFALGAAVCWGTTDFVAGLLSRRSDSTAVAVSAHLTGVALVAAAVPLVPASGVPVQAIVWGAASGIGTGVGVGFLYRAMSVGRFSVVVPASDVAAVAVPVVAGALVFTDRPDPAVWAGIAIAPPALWLLARNDPAGVRDGAARGVGPALVAGLGFALQYIGLAQTQPGEGLWPLAANRVFALITLVVLARGMRDRLWPPGRVAVASCATGLLAAAGILLYALAARQQLLAIAVVLAGMYPAIPVLLGFALLRERLRPPQIAGLGLGLAAVALIAAG